MRFDLEIDFEEAVLGSEREITFPVNETCKTCKGSGAAAGSQKETCIHCAGTGNIVTSSGLFQMQQTCPTCGGQGKIIKNPCATCHGNGLVRGQKKLSVKIPPGVETGSRLRLSGKGESGVQGGPAGDLYIVLHVREHNIFQRRDNDVYCKIPIPYHIAALGGEIQVPTIHGYAKLKVPPGTNNGKVFRLRGKGVTGMRGYHNGDQHVYVVVEVPTHLHGKQKKKLKELAEVLTKSNHPEIKQFEAGAEKFFERKRKMENK